MHIFMEDESWRLKKFGEMEIREGSPRNPSAQ
jgi:hypothetical protein